MTDILVCYYRDGCHLCEQLATLLARRWPDEARLVEWRDVDRSAAWRECYGSRVPVLMAGERVICDAVLDPGGLDDYFGRPGDTV